MDNRLYINLDEKSHDGKIKPYSVYYFSANMDHVMNDDANMPPFSKASSAKILANQFYGDPVGMAKMFIDHPYAVKHMSYAESWNYIQEGINSLYKGTNINILFEKLLKRIQ